MTTVCVSISSTCKNSTAEIYKMIEKIQDKTKMANDNLNNGLKLVDSGVSSSQKTHEHFTKIESGAHDVIHLINELNNKIKNVIYISFFTSINSYTFVRFLQNMQREKIEKSNR